ncbi:MAG: 3-hydroxybutyryl-CoA dehydrogenase [Solirubrobacterales bacterium]|jgi:3-hydroxybutyryl-CoA dehydrogenase|nr:3-hydroxybutyryl-CoA dehydrogenase [Solirubrobacterales bacterium]
MRIELLGVAGAGTMGAGIAQLGCLGGFETRLWDPAGAALAAGAERLRADLDRGVQRGRWSAEDAERAAARLVSTASLDALDGCDLVIEAAPEDLELKRALYERLEAVCGPDAVLATNTSSLPVGRIAAGAKHPERICGMHFFNPPALMRLVEVVATETTAQPALAAATAVAERMGRTAVRCADSPGFIVNRCNRPFTLESLRILERGIAGHDQIDRVIREQGGYRMGPFELMDLIGIDVNLEVARSFYRQRPEPRWKPHPIQERMVAEGHLGRKTGRGFYRYRGGRREQAEETAELPEPVRRVVLERVVAQLVNEACFAAEEGVAEPDDIDAAMRLGLNHPRGPFGWLRALGAERVEEILDALAAESDERYRAAPLLRRLTGSAQSS